MATKLAAQIKGTVSEQLILLFGLSLPSVSKGMLFNIVSEGGALMLEDYIKWHISAYMSLDYM